MTAKKKENQNVLNRIERFVALIFVALFLFWFVRKCARSSQMKPQQPVSQTKSVDSTNKTLEERNKKTITPTKIRVDTVVKTITIPPVMYVSIEGLKLRAEPYLDKPVIMELPVNSTLTFLDEKTAFTQKVTLDNVTYNEPWLKIRTADNQEGWVYGGGVRCYKK